LAVLVLTGLLRYLVAVDWNEAIPAVVIVLAVALITGSTRAAAFVAVLALAALLGLKRLNRV
jgi:hypothetical protein